jgi:hypothetical protein
MVPLLKDWKITAHPTVPTPSRHPAHHARSKRAAQEDRQMHGSVGRLEILLQALGPRQEPVFRCSAYTKQGKMGNAARPPRPETRCLQQNQQTFA